MRSEIVATGSKNAYEIYFQFDRSWNRLIGRTAVFYQPSVNKDNPTYVLLDENNKVTIPLSNLVVNDYLYIGVFGFTPDGNVRVPTVFTYTYVKQGCYDIKEAPMPDKSVYEDIYLMACKAYKTALDVVRRADAGEFDGVSPEITVKENSGTKYILTITDRNGSFDTPNLKGESGDLSYCHEQVLPSDEWTVVHGLDKYPSVTIVDENENVVLGAEVEYVDRDTVIVRLAEAMVGKAIMN